MGNPHGIVRRAFRLVARSIPETAAVIIGFLGREWRLSVRKLGHIVGKVVTIEATITLGEVIHKIEIDGGGSGGKKQGDEWNKPPLDSPQIQSFQIREQRFIDGAKLDGRENFRGRRL
jgi:hypothetical protein